MSKTISPFREGFAFKPEFQTSLRLLNHSLNYYFASLESDSLPSKDDIDLILNRIKDVIDLSFGHNSLDLTQFYAPKSITHETY